MNIRTRLSLLFVLLVALIMLLFTVTVYFFYEQFRQQEFRQRLEDKAFTNIRLREDVGEVPQNDLPIMVNERVTIYTDQGQVLYSRGNRQSRILLTADLLRRINLRQTQYLRRGDIEAVGVRYRNKQGQSFVIVASACDRYGLSKLDRLRELLIYGWLISLSIAGLAGYLFATDALRPVAELIGQVNAISAINMHRRLRVGRQRDELAALARTFNDLLNRLEDAFVSQKSFVSHASHELRTPLTVMMGQIEVTRLSPRTGPEYEAALDSLLDEVQGMIRLVNGLLELAQANADVTTLNHQPLRIDELLWQVQSHFAQKKANAQIDIDFVNFPDQEEELVILGDESLLHTALLNLIENGRKYSSDQRISVRIAFEPGEVLLTISDTGQGIPPDDLPRIFEPFFRSENALTTQGHGIGLALTKRIINLHRGHIVIESTLGQGTTVRLTLPTQRSEKKAELTH